VVRPFAITKHLTIKHVGAAHGVRWAVAMNTHGTRRWTLSLLTAGIFAAFTSRSEANDPTPVDVEASAWGGTASGHLPARGGCAFAPTVGTTLGGAGGRVRVRPGASRAEPDRGWQMSAQGAVEYQSNTTLAEGSDRQTAVPDNQPMAGGAVEVGYDWRYFGAHGGVLVRQTYGAPSIPINDMGGDVRLDQATYPSTAVSAFPQVTLRGGPTDGFHGELGIGAYTPAMVMRPGLHAGLGYSTRAGYDVMGRCGVQSTTRDTGALRCDVSGAVPLNEQVSLGVGGAVVDSETRLDFDARASVIVRFGR
jgi:hypothetical protein